MNLPGTTSNARTTFVEGMKPDEKPVSSSGNPLPPLHSRPWFFSLLPAADIRRTEVSLNTVQRRFAGFIRFIATSALTKKGAESVVKASETLLEAAKTNKANDIQGNAAVHADINHADSDGMSAIMHAAKNGNLGLIETLVTAGSKINAVNNVGKTALMLAAENGHVDVFEYLLNWGADITKREGKGLTALALAACSGKTALLQSFIDAGVAIDEPMSNGSTPVMYAAEAGHIEFVKALIENGADINQGNIKNRWTALMYAAAQGRTDVVEFLLANKANVDARDNGQTALMRAATQGRNDVVKVLLANKASVDAKDKHGQTALMMAAYHGHTDVVELLLAQGASVEAKSTSGLTALIYAAMQGQHATLTSIIESCAEPYKALRGVLHKGPDITKVFVRAWLNSTKSKPDAVAAICCVFDSGPELRGSASFNKTEAMYALASGGLTLTQEDFERLKLSVDLSTAAHVHLKEIFINGNMPREVKIGNAYWSGNPALVDELADLPYKTLFNPLGLRLSPNIEDFNPDHCIDDRGDYLHAVGKLHDQSPKMDGSCDMDP